MRSQSEDVNMFQPFVKAGMHWGIDKQILGGPITLTRESSPIQMLDANGVARVVTLPAPERGLAFWFYNSAAGAFGLTITTPIGPATIGTVAQGKMSMAFSDGVNWFYAGFA